jgi:hypothetical protein
LGVGAIGRIRGLITLNTLTVTEIVIETEIEEISMIVLGGKVR